MSVEDRGSLAWKLLQSILCELYSQVVRVTTAIVHFDTPGQQTTSDHFFDDGEVSAVLLGMASPLRGFY